MNRLSKHHAGRILTIVLLALLMLMAVACGGNDTPSATPTATPTIAPENTSEPPATGEPASQGINLTDMMGRSVSLAEPAKKVISLTPSNTEIIYALGLEDRLIGVDMYSDYPPEAQAVEKIGDYNAPSAELIVGMEADLVLAGDKLQQDIIAQLEGLDQTVLATESGTLEGIEESIRLVATALGAEEKADTLIQRMHETRDRIAALVDGARKPSVYYVMSYGEFGNWTSGPGTFINTVVNLAGGTCVTDDGAAAWMEYSMEELIAKDPDFLLVSSDVGTVEELSIADGYKDLSAVKNGNVFLVDANMLSRPGPRIYDAMEMVAKILHADLVQ